MSTCPRPDKTAYESRAAVTGALRRMRKPKKNQGLHPYKCRCGRWHLGRTIRRAPIAWKATP